MFKRVAGGVLLVLVLVISLTLLFRHQVVRAAASLPPFTHEYGSKTVELVAMRDGISLHTEVFRPQHVERAPTVLVRNPYENLRFFERLTCEVLTRYGYACVLQDVRGQLDSEGEWSPIIHERDDGIDTLAWLTKQTFHDGNIGMRGPSYLTCTQWAVADVLPPEVKTLVPSVFGTDLRLAMYERGLLHHDLLTAWATLMPKRGMNSWAGNDYLQAAKHLPATEADERFMGGKLEWYRDTLFAAAPDAPYWHSEAMKTFRETPERSHVPMLFIAAYFEPFFTAQLDTWNRLASQSESAMVVGPWNHLGITSGDVDFDRATPGRLDQLPMILEWFEHMLKGKPLKTIEPGTVKTFAVNARAWTTHRQWPDASVPRETLQLGSLEASKSCEGGTLGAEAATTPVTYVFDPSNPVPTRGGASLLSFAFFRTLGITPGPVSQGKSCEREDVLTFKAAPVKKPQRLSGSATVKLRVSSSAPDTAFVARLIAEHQGRSVLVRENAATFAFPVSEMSAALPTPGTPVELRIDFWPIEWELPEGANWRLDVTSSSFPALHVHSNRAGPWEAQTGFEVATQTVLGGELELPLIPLQ